LLFYDDKTKLPEAEKLKLYKTEQERGSKRTSFSIVCPKEQGVERKSAGIGACIEVKVQTEAS